MATRMLGALRLLGTEQAMVFHGDDGLDELTTSTTSTVHELVDGEVHTFTLDPLDLGIPRASADTLAGGDASSNADAIRAVLSGEKGSHKPGTAESENVDDDVDDRYDNVACTD